MGEGAPQAPRVEKNPREEMLEVLAYLKYAWKPGSTWKGTAVFDIPPSPVSPPFKMYIRVDPKAGGVTEADLSLPPDGKYNVYTEMSRDDFFFIYSGEASTGMVASMCLTGRMKVKWLKFHELQGFAGSFDFSTPAWMGYYRTTGQLQQAKDLLADAWVKSRKKGTVVDPDGNTIDPNSVDPAVLAAWERAATGAAQEFHALEEGPAIAEVVSGSGSEAGEQSAAISGGEAGQEVEQVAAEEEEADAAPAAPAISVLVSDVAVLDLTGAGADTHIELPVATNNGATAEGDEAPTSSVPAAAEAMAVELGEATGLVEELGAPEVETGALVAATAAAEEEVGSSGVPTKKEEAPEAAMTPAAEAVAAAEPATGVAPQAAAVETQAPSAAVTEEAEAPVSAPPAAEAPPAPAASASVLVKLADLIARGPFAVETLPPGTQLEGLLLTDGAVLATPSSPGPMHAWDAVRYWSPEEPPSANGGAAGGANGSAGGASTAGASASAATGAAAPSVLDSVFSVASAAGKAVVDFLPFTGSSEEGKAGAAEQQQPATGTSQGWFGSLFTSTPPAATSTTQTVAEPEMPPQSPAAAVPETSPALTTPTTASASTQADFAADLVSAYATGVYTAALLSRGVFSKWLAAHSLVGAVASAAAGPAAVASRFPGYAQLALHCLPTEWQRQQWYEIAFAEALIRAPASAGTGDSLPVNAAMVATAERLSGAALGKAPEPLSPPVLLPSVAGLARACVQHVAPEALWRGLFQSSAAPLAPVFGEAAAAEASELLAPFASALDAAVGEEDQQPLYSSSSSSSGPSVFDLTASSAHAAGSESNSGSDGAGAAASAEAASPPDATAFLPAVTASSSPRVLDKEALAYLRPYATDATPFSQGTTSSVLPPAFTLLPPLPPEPVRDLEGEALASYIAQLRASVSAPSPVNDISSLMPGAWSSQLLFNPACHSPPTLRRALTLLPRVLSPLEASTVASRGNGSRNKKAKAGTPLPLSETAFRIASFWGWTGEAPQPLPHSEGEEQAEPRKRLLLTPAHAETLSWCLGSRFAHRYPSAPLTLGAVQFLQPGGEGSDVTEARLMPIWAPGNLRTSAASGGAAPEAVLYAGPGSGLFYGTALARLRLGLEPATAGAAPHGVGGSSGKLLGSADWEAGLEALRTASRGSLRLPVGGGRHVAVALSQHTSPEDEAVLADPAWDADASLQAAAPPRTSLFTLLRSDASSL